MIINANIKNSKEMQNYAEVQNYKFQELCK